MDAATEHELAHLHGGHEHTEWGGTPAPQRCGTMARRVDHLAERIVREIQKSSGRVGEQANAPHWGALTRMEFRRWVLAKVIGGAANELHEMLPIGWARGETD
jgi:hypothetical protein